MNLQVTIAYCAALFCALLAAGVLFQGRHSTAQWAFVGGMLVLAGEACLEAFSADTLLAVDAAHWQERRLWAGTLGPGLWLLFSMTYARGNARDFVSRWSILLAVIALLPGALALLAGGRVIDSVGQEHFGAPWVFRLTLEGNVINFLLLVSCILVLTNLERTYRTSVGTMRWRIKFMILGLAVLFGVRAYTGSQALLYQSVGQHMSALNNAAACVAALLIVRTLLRTGHFEVSVYPSHALIHNSLTILVAGLYLVIVGVLAKATTWLGREAGLPAKALIVLLLLVALTIILMSDRVRMRTRQFVSRHFQRPLYDYRTVWRTFTEGTARVVEQGQLCATVVKMVSQIFQALSVTVWLLDEKKERLIFADSTFLDQAKAEQMSLEPSDAGAIIQAFKARPEPVDLDSTKEFWAAPLRRCHPDDFQKGGNRVAVPMIAGGELVGLLTLGDRVSGLQFGTQDMDLLKSVADQAAAGLLNIQLSQKLSQSKQLEAFQAMSAFFVHDLKNTASTLSLMLRNLPVHYQDPRFREDALRGISKTVEHINDVIGRLNVLRHELVIQAAPCNLNELVLQTLKAYEQQPGIEVVKELGTVPEIKVDAGQIQKVITNLVLNAREAISGGGSIRVQTTQQNSWVVLRVSDTGCGMTPEFLRGQLFRPFQTTKKKGIGIGMFHCKMIVEAHRGRIEVESEPGMGTSFSVLLPIS